MAFYSRKLTPYISEKRELFEKEDGLIFMKERHFEVIKIDRSHNRYITYYFEIEYKLMQYSHFFIHINIGPICGMLEKLREAIWHYYTDESVAKVFYNYPTLKEYLLKGGEYKGLSIMASDWGKSDLKDKDGLYYGKLSVYNLNYGNEMSLEVEEKQARILVEFADKIIYELSHLSFNPNDLVRKPHEAPKPTPEWIRNVQRVGIRVGAKMLSGFVGGAFGDFDVPDVDYGNVSIPDVDWSTFDFSGGDSNFDFPSFDSDADFGDGLAFYGKTKDSLPDNANSDGYIPDGSISLTTTISDITKSFKHYKKDGHDYVLYYGNYIRVDGIGTVTIGGVKYDKV